MTGLTLPLETEQLVPHRLPMRLVDRLLSIDGKDGVVETLVRPDAPLVDEAGRLEEVALIELIAQSYAALKGYLDRSQGKPVRQGFLVGIKKLECLAAVRAGTSLRIAVRTLAELDDFAVAAGEIHAGEDLIARGEIKIWLS